MKQIEYIANAHTLRKISSLFKSSYENIDDLMRLLLETARDIIGAKNSSLLLWNEKSQALQFYQASGKGGMELAKFDIPVGKGFAGIVAETREPLVSNDVKGDTRWYREVSEKASMDVESLACLPLNGENGLIGVVQFLDKINGGPFTDRDMSILEQIAHIMAMFLEVSKSKELLGEEFHRLQEKYWKRFSIVGESAAIRKCIAQAERVAESKASILLTGESGTGKELFAHLIHDRGPRQTKPFISISCGALPASILERELFGHEKGAFTGADSRKIGLFEAANTGTLFLDEIGEMPIDMQVKLLRVLQEESFVRLGGTQPTKVDVRIVSATNKDLEKMIQEGKFRQDLYYRINVINIELPSLRDRVDDIPDLVNYFIKKHNMQGNQPFKKLQKGLLSHLKGYSWPGNIRQLENSVERAIVLAEGDELTVDSFPFESSDSAIEVNVGATLKEANDAFRHSFITNTLKSTGGNRTKAAKILDVQRSYLSRLIKELGIN